MQAMQDEAERWLRQAEDESAIPAECYTAVMAQETLEWADTILQFVTKRLR